MSKVGDAVLYAAKGLGLTELEQALAAGTEPEGEALEQQKDLLRCLNLAAGDMALCSVALVKSKTVAVTGGSALYSKIDVNLIELRAVYDGDGRKVAFTPYSDRFLAEDGVYTVEYRYLPGTLGMNDDLPFPAGAGEKAAAYGAACEYCIVCGRNNEAVKWENLFVKEREKIEKIRTRRSFSLRPRRWY